MCDFSYLEKSVNKLDIWTDPQIGLPGNWSPTIFFQDLDDYPIKTDLKNISSEISKCLNQKNPSYLDFFKKTRGTDRFLHYTNTKCKIHEDFIQTVWDIFSQTDIMMYFELEFLRILKKSCSDDFKYDKILLQYIDLLSENSILVWNEILKNIGCCSYKYFAKEPELYIKLLSRTEINSSDDMMDIEILNCLYPNSKCPTRHLDLWNLRSDLVKHYQSTI